MEVQSSMERHKCKIKFDKGKVVCASEILCKGCPEEKNCEEIVIYIDSKYAGITDCMSHDGYERKHGKIKQTRFEKR